MLISYSIDNGIYKHNLDDLSFNHLNHTTIKYKDLVGSGKKKITFDYCPGNLLPAQIEMALFQNTSEHY